MSSTEPVCSAAGRWLAVLRQRPLAVATGILLIVLAVQALTKRESEWQQVFVAAGRQLIDGGDIYDGTYSYLYPPFMAMVSAPFSFLPPLVSRLLWFAASAFCMIAMIRAAWTLAGGAPLAGIRQWDRRELVAAGLGLACAMTYILNAFAHQQVDIITGALMMVGAAHLLTHRQGSGGAMIGLAAACKATPLLWLPYLLLRRRLLAGMLVGVVALAVNLIPDLIAPAPAGGTWLERWIVRYVLPSQQLAAPLGTWGSALIYNQSLSGTTQRLVNTTLAYREGKLAVVERPLVDGLRLKLICYVLIAVLVLVSVAAAIRAPPAPATGAFESPVVFEFGMVVTLMLLMSPMSSKAHFGTLILPGFCLARYAMLNRSRLVGGLVIAAAVLAVICNKDPVGANAYTALLWSGVITASTLLLWLGCVVVVARAPRAPWPA